MKRVARSAIVEHAAAAVYSIVEDIESYPEFLPWCRAAKVLERSPTRTVATLTVGVRGIRQSFTTENANRPGEGIDLRLLAGAEIIELLKTHQVEINDSALMCSDNTP